MPQLLYSAKDPQGNTLEGFVEAGSVAQAQQLLAMRGWSQIVIHNEPNFAADPALLDGLDADQRRALARLNIETMQRPGFGPVLRAVARMNRWWLLMDAGLAAWGYYTGNVWLLALAAALALLPFAFAAWNHRNSGRYTALIKCFSVGDWEAVTDLAGKLRSISAKTALLDFDLDVRLASIKARRGQLAEGLADVEHWRAQLSDKPGLFEGRIAAIHASAEDRVGFVRLMSEARQLAPADPTRICDHALAEARFGDIAVASDLLASIDESLLPPHGHGFIAWTQGVIDMRRNEPTALHLLGRAVAEFLKLSGQPAAWTALAFCTCDHAIALVKAGNKEEAKREIAQVWPIIRAHGDKPLLNMLQADGLLPN